MTTPAAGKKAPKFSVQNQDSKTRTLSDYAGKWLVLYFYPRDNTSGCTTEAKDFTSLKRQFSANGAAIVGVSPDSIASHQRFQGKQNLKIELLSDPDQKMCNAYGVWQKKKMAGREYMGVLRTTFLIAPDGKVENVWEKVKVKDHADVVLGALRKAK